MAELSFFKYQGAGNDFILVDDRSLFFPVSKKFSIKRLCDRHFGIGADGLILLQPSKCADFRMRIFNADGSEPTMCGNGLRSLVHFCSQLGWKNKKIKIETGAGIFHCFFHEEEIGILHGNFSSSYAEYAFERNGNVKKIYYVNSGVPHAIIFEENILDLDVEKEGKQIRFSPIFQPEGVNVNFVEKISDTELYLRTYERGVEQETLACGTGIVAAAFVGTKMLGIHYPMRVKTDSEQIFKVLFFSEEALEVVGRVECVFEGKIQIT